MEIAGEIIGGILSPMLVALLVRGVRRNAQQTNLLRKKVECSFRLKSFALLAALFLAAIAVLSCFAEKTEDQWSGLLAGGFAALGGAAFCVDCFCRRLVYDEHQILCFSAWGSDQHALWEEVREVSYSPLCQWFVIHAGKRKIRIYEFMDGAREFVERVESQGINIPVIVSTKIR
ncbi:hypothetical protein [Prosthecobacter vanneervenii]|uniref:Uncharacterized protein n=1 Tax=Prosthecobacter vanneervenii TaxID=48466 RepID=A0A7W7YB28_9BACT|nr:hypothetical protein [Prosthecobacter vanneervenii]MBB5032829.1 hypothetical protein [Prosthecobacter vanneervenii]